MNCIDAVRLIRGSGVPRNRKVGALCSSSVDGFRPLVVVVKEEKTFRLWLLSHACTKSESRRNGFPVF